jgi:hypothetical protein
LAFAGYDEGRLPIDFIFCLILYDVFAWEWGLVAPASVLLLSSGHAVLLAWLWIPVHCWPLQPALPSTCILTVEEHLCITQAVCYCHALVVAQQMREHELVLARSELQFVERSAEQRASEHKVRRDCVHVCVRAHRRECFFGATTANSQCFCCQFQRQLWQLCLPQVGNLHMLMHGFSAQIRLITLSAVTNAACLPACLPAHPCCRSCWTAARQS